MYRHTRICPFAGKQPRQGDSMYSSFYSETQQTTAVAIFTLHQLYSRQNSKQYTLNSKLGGKQNQPAETTITLQWLLAFDYDDWSKQHRNAVTWLLGHMILHKFQSTRKLTLIYDMEFLWRADCKTQRVQKYFQTLLWPLGQGFVTSHNHLWEPKKKWSGIAQSEHN
jgi:hypothetical protein